MLSFTTEFPVEETSIEVFCKSVAAWLEGSPHTEITSDQVWDLATSENRIWSNGEQELSCEICDEGSSSAAGFKYIASEGGIQWVTTVCFSSDAVDSWVSVRTERQSTTANPRLPDAKKPFIVRNLLQGLTGGVDGELRVFDRSHRLTDADSSMVVRLMNGDSEHHLPIVYISYPFQGEHVIDADALARHLGGVAHVLVEPSRDFSRRIQSEVFSNNPYGGYVGIFYHQGRSKRLAIEDFDSDFDIRRAIFHEVRQALLNRMPLSRCSWPYIQASAAKIARQKLKQSGSESVEKYIESFDKELQAKEDQIADAQKEIFSLRSTISELEKKKSKSTGLAISVGSEQQLVDDEFIEIILDSINSSLANSTNFSRRQDVLQAIVDSNESSGSLKRRQEDIKAVLRGYRNLTATIRSDLLKMGFEISEDGKHHKLIYRGDQRYAYVLSKSCSDNRGGLNAATDIAKKMF